MNKSVILTLVIIFISSIGFTSLTVQAHGEEQHGVVNNPMFTGLDTDAAKAVQQFHQALKTKDAEMAQAVLDENVLIYESGHAERSAKKYASGHMHADMKYLESISSELIEHHVTVTADMAISTSRSKNTRVVAGEETVNTASETIVLSKINGKWLITHIHWS